jgi:hypothetical protein
MQALHLPLPLQLLLSLLPKCLLPQRLAWVLLRVLWVGGQCTHPPCLAHALMSPQAIGDIVVGSVLGPSSQRANEARIASFFAGIPEEVPVRTVNRWE